MRVPRLSLWVDTDVALGAESGDVDDGFALAALLRAARRGRLDLLGISTVFGNATAAESEECARRIAELAGVAVAVVRGSEVGSRQSAASERIAALPEGAELLCLGPLTNVAAACRQDASLPSRVRLRASAAISPPADSFRSSGPSSTTSPETFGARGRRCARAGEGRPSIRWRWCGG